MPLVGLHPAPRSSLLHFPVHPLHLRSSATNRLITAKDHAAVQLNVGKVDDQGRLTGEVETFALCGFIRTKGLGDDCLNRLVKEKELLDDLEPASE